MAIGLPRPTSEILKEALTLTPKGEARIRVVEAQNSLWRSKLTARAFAVGLALIDAGLKDVYNESILPQSQTWKSFFIEVVATMMQESNGMKYINGPKNKDGSTDYSICMINSNDVLFDDSQKYSMSWQAKTAVAIMRRRMANKQHPLSAWVGWKSGRHVEWLPVGSDAYDWLETRDKK